MYFSRLSIYLHIFWYIHIYIYMHIYMYIQKVHCADGHVMSQGCIRRGVEVWEV